LRNFGFFIEVSDLGLGGLVHLSSLADDFYVFDGARNRLMGRRTRRIIKPGDRLVVQVSKVDAFKKQVDFQLAAAPKTQSAGRRF
jgi:ribonuclease R